MFSVDVHLKAVFGSRNTDLIQAMLKASDFNDPNPGVSEFDLSKTTLASTTAVRGTLWISKSARR